MSLQFKKIHVQDERLQVKDDIGFAVMSGAENINQQLFPPIASSTSQLSWNINVPSLTTIVDRRVLLNTEVTFTITGIPASGQYLVDFSAPNCGLESLPLSQLCSTQSCQINNTTVSINLADCLPAITRMVSKDDMMILNSTSPCYPDNYRYLSDATGSNNNPLNGYNSSDLDTAYRGRNSYVVEIVSGNGVGDGVTVKSATLKVKLTEPLLLSPFCFNGQANSAGLFGVNTITLTLNINSSPANFFVHTGQGLVAGNTPSVQIQSFTNTSLQFNFLSPSASQLASIPATCSTPYLDMPRYLTSFQSPLASGQRTTLTSANLQLTGVPDRIAIFVRKAGASRTCLDSDYMLAINGIKINWNNRSGLLSTASPYQLYQMSREAGNNAQSWLEWSGKASKLVSGQQAPQSVVTAGSLLCLEFGKHIPLQDEYVAPSSYGQFNLQFDIDVTNYGSDSVTPEIVLICFFSGIFQSTQGSSATFSNILSKQDILDAKSEEPISMVHYDRMVGSGFWDRVKSVAKWLHHKAIPEAKKFVEQHVKHPYADKGLEVLKTLGYGRSGSGLKGRIK
jgi:hypothetical protein